MYRGKCLSPERSGIIGKSRDYNDYCCLCCSYVLFRNLSLDIIHYELEFWVIFVMKFYFSFLSSNYTIIIMNKMIEVNTCISQERLP